MTEIKEYLPRLKTIFAARWDGTDESSKVIHDWVAQSPPSEVPSQAYSRAIIDTKHIAHRYSDEDQAYVLLYGTMIAADKNVRYLIIHTLEGAMLAAPGDYIIRGLKGEFYPCKPDIFAEKYFIIDENPDFVMEGPNG